MIKILFICHGNICRSTMAEYVMKHLVKQAGLEDAFYIDSAATSREEIGNGVHHGTKRKLARMGVPCGDHRARQMTREDYEEFDLLIGMDNANIRNMTRIAGGDPEKKIYKILWFTDRDKMGTPESRRAAFWGEDLARKPVSRPTAACGGSWAEMEQGSGARNARPGVPRQSGLCDDDVADPWYTGDFDATWDDVFEGCTRLLELLKPE